MMKSRSAFIADVPEPSNLVTNFVYNFFVSNERVDDSGSPYVKGVKNENLQKLVDYSSLQFEVPRYVEISFSQVEIFSGPASDAANQFAFNEANIQNANSEETITNTSFVSLRETDDDAIPRIKEKLDALSKSLNLNFQDSDQSKKIAAKLGVNQDDVQSIISPLNNEKFLVNSKKVAAPVSSFQLAAEHRIISQINRRLAGSCINSADDSSPLSKSEIIQSAKLISKDFISKSSSLTFTDSDTDPTIRPILFESTSEKESFIGMSAIGYLLTRYRIGDDGKKKETRVFFMSGPDNTKYLDSEVFYGCSYSYDVRAVYQVDAIMNGKVKTLQVTGNSSDNNKNWRVSFLLTSRPSFTSRVRTEEFEPPQEPDGVMYNFNYDTERGLVIRWQIPTGRSRDVKYFQVFRRKSIFNPFVCIAQIDFDDSFVRTLLPEQVREDRIFGYKGVRTFYEDTEFDRNSKYIYTVAAVDAHGLTSGYSAQTEVGFNKVKNQLTLKSVSRGGAPKQYPNFYVDPRMDDNIAVDSFTQDAIFDSGHKKIKVYFTPDARVMTNSNGDTENVFYTDNDRGEYTFHFINLDSQKSSKATISVTDLRKKT